MEWHRKSNLKSNYYIWRTDRFCPVTVKKKKKKEKKFIFKYISMSTGIVRHFAKSFLAQSLKAFVSVCLHLSSTFIRVSLETKGRYRVPTPTLVN